MPRISPSLIRRVARQHVLLPLLLRECRDLTSAKNELRWLSEHAVATRDSTSSKGEGIPRRAAYSLSPNHAAWPTLKQNVLRRSVGEPLQYILGTQPFGDLEILCRKRVLIPRSDTESYTTKLAGLVEQIFKDGVASVDDKRGLRILDLCTGTGCIALLLHSLLKATTESQNMPLEIVAVDLSETAIKLGEENRQHNIRQGNLLASATADVKFVVSDVFELQNEARNPQRDTDTTHLSSRTQVSFGSRRTAAFKDITKITATAESDKSKREPSFDIVIANPPYISPRQYAPGGTTARSVRLYEPRIALVPPGPISGLNEYHTPPKTGAIYQADLFYPAIHQIAEAVQAKVVVMEVGDKEQATRVTNWVSNMSEQSSDDIEVWNDGDDGAHRGPCNAEARTVVVWRGQWAQWRRRVLGRTGRHNEGTGS